MLTDKDIDLSALTEKIIGSAYTVSNNLGAGFLEKVYENALAIELHKSQLRYQQQYPIKVIYDGVVVGEYISDLIVESRIIVDKETVSFAQRVDYSGRPLWPCPGMGAVKMVDE